MSWTRRAAVAIAVALVPSAAVACLWDYDTLLQERGRFPGTLELITGKFLRHSPEFYEWRVRDREAKRAADPHNLALLDDLAVAYHKTGRNDKAIETALATDKLQPNRYETVANLSTFLVLTGRWEEGLAQVNRALAINPDAHFGREKYQKALVEYVLKQRPDGKVTLPLMDDPSNRDGTNDAAARGPFSQFLALSTGRLTPVDRPAAIKGVLGMMRFADHDNPLLLEALGGLLADIGSMPHEDAKRLAARAYLKASYAVTDEAAKAAYRKAAAGTLKLQVEGPTTGNPVTLERVEADFRTELAEARAWYEELRQREIGWIRDGQNPDEEFAKLYRGEPEIYPPPSALEVADDWFRRPEHALLVAGIVALLTPVVVLPAVLVWFRRRKRRSAGAGAPAVPLD